MGWLSAGRPCWLGVSLLGGALLLGACGSGSADEREVLSATAEPATATVVIPETLPSGEEPSRWGYHPGRETGERDPPPTFSALPAGYLIETFAAGLKQPTSMAFTPDGRLLVAEQGGAVRVVENGILQPNPFFTAPVFLPEAENEIVELGLVGIAVDPDFERNGYVYVYYTTDQPARRTVLGRLQDVGGQGKKLEEVLSLDAAPKCCHIAGSLRFAPDGTLF
ncbi:MAG: PQQ-dependent sugar dehydrogenase, partial [Dehalococcoidia bacterium]|nr:PQQ-dependent sugar dehydrogenase [Dehalococcoidia bacterium]